MKQKKLSARILSLVLTAAMALTMLPATSIKAEAVETTIVTRTTPLDLTATSVSYVDTHGDTKTADPTKNNITDTGEGWTWDFDTSTLTLSGATIDCTGNTPKAENVFGIQLAIDHDIFLAEGSTNTVKAGSSTELNWSHGVHFLGEDNAVESPSISGTGTLNAIGGAPVYESTGIFCGAATLTFSEATINASSAATNAGTGICGLIDIKSGTIKATGTGAGDSGGGYGIQTASMTMSGGNVTATGTGPVDGYGIAKTGNFLMTGGTLSASGKSYVHAYGICGNGNVLMTGGTLSAFGNLLYNENLPTPGTTAAIAPDDFEPDMSEYTITADGATVTGATEAFVSGTTKTLEQAKAGTPVVISFIPRVIFDARNGVDIPDAEISESGKITMPNEPVWGNYEFLGWFTDLDSAGTEFVNEGLSNSITVYAKWKATNDKIVCTAPLNFTEADENIDRRSTEGWAWNKTNKILTLDDATIDCTGNDDVAGIVYAIQLLTDHDIVLADGSTNIVKAGDSTNTISRGIYFEDVNESATTPSISGNGTLKVTGGAAGGDSSQSFGIACEATETLVFIDATIIAASSASAQLGAGIAGLIDIRSGKITANGTGDAYGYGIQSAGVTMTGGKLSASGKTAAIATEGEGTITAVGATVTGATEAFESGTTKTLKQENAKIPVVISFTPSVTFDARNGGIIPDAKITDGKITLPAEPTWGNYKFEGWYTDIDDDGTGVKVTTETNFTQSDTVYARWTNGGKTVCTEALDFTVAIGDLDCAATDGWAWDQNTQTITLSGATIDCSGHDAAAGIAVYGIQLLSDQNIVLAEGSTNIIKAGDSANTISVGICYNVLNENAASPSISGKGTLEVTGGAVGDEGVGSYGIVCSENETLTFKDATIIASSSVETEFGAGISGLIDIQSGKITATGTGTISGCGIQSTGIAMTMSGGTVTATGTGNAQGYGIDGIGDFDFEGGMLLLSGKTAAITTELGGTINAGGATVTGANEKFESGTTETLTQKVQEKPVKISFADKPDYKGANPLAPTPVNKTHVTVTLKTQTIAGETVEYGIRTISGKIHWQDSPTFSGLTANTKYEFYARVKATAAHKAGIKSAAMVIETQKAPVYIDDESATAIYLNTMNKPENGTASMSPDWPSKGQVITITTRPNAGYEVDSVIAKDASGKVIAVAEKGANSYTFSQPESKVAVEVTYKKIGASGAHAFTDVTANDWFYAAVTKATANGWFSGTSDTIFSPLAPTNRGMAATILYRIEGQPKVNGAIFKDVAADAYYANGVAWAAEKSITRGYDNGNYGPNDNITREQLATILYRYAGYKGYDVSKRAALDGFIDSNSVSDYAKEAMSWAVGSGIISGRENNTLAPTQIANRAEVAAILVRFAELFAK